MPRMNETSASASFSRFIHLVAAALQPIAPLVTRLVVGQAYMQTGYGKWSDIEKFVSFFSSLGIPAPRPNAYFVATLELVGGACLLLGLGTRVFALLLSATMVVALMTADREAFLAALAVNPEHGLLDVTPVPFLLFLLWLAAFGPGPLSVDRVISRRVRERA
jgi:putative oxidoreductase